MIFSVSGHVNKPQNIELPLGIPFKDLLEICGGVRGGRKLKAVIPGGVSVPVVPGDVMMTANLDYDSVKKAGSALGTGSLIVMDDTTCMVKTLERITRFYYAESCGQCTPCREGTGWMNRVVKRILAGEGKKADLDMLVDVANKIEGHTICAFGDASAWPVQSFMKHYRHEFEYMIEHGHSIVEQRRGGLRDELTMTVNIEVNGVPMKARKGQMIIQVTDAGDVYVPRFCYHDKLTIAANCRMCLVEVEKAPKPMPACATPVAEGMKVFTKSPKAIAAQRATMEFLLINHPLDCPICDQGGECELQDLAMGFGRDISRYNERKRVVKDKNLGPLVSTDMTRCIHCTRCVRFTQEIQGFQELGTIGRGEMTEIGTFIERSVDHELSANIIDLCPVGALNNKPYRYRARAWEMTQHPLVSPHDSVGTNIYAHVLRGRVMRIVPRPNEAVNETWIADRDRFSYQGIYSEDRLLKPMIRDNGVWQETDWETALAMVAERLGRSRQAARRRADRRARCAELRRSRNSICWRASRAASAAPISIIACVARISATRRAIRCIPRSAARSRSWSRSTRALVVGSNLRKEVPLLAHRLRKAALRGAKISFVNPQRYEYLFPVADYLAANGLDMFGHLVAIAAAASACERQEPRRSRLRRSSPARSRPMRIVRSRSNSATVRAA